MTCRVSRAGNGQDERKACYGKLSRGNDGRDDIRRMESWHWLSGLNGLRPLRARPYLSAAIVSVAETIGCLAQTLYECVRKVYVGSGGRTGTLSNLAGTWTTLKWPLSATQQTFCSPGAIQPARHHFTYVPQHSSQVDKTRHRSAFAIPTRRSALGLIIEAHGEITCRISNLPNMSHL